ncbi:MAG: type II toxin-antitoxin system RelE/ParE family toxin [Firmicutes bacterium HGW-Firmicutes-1]|jgi:plasmid stabilization system protein ParE|nr:MAG: type II toxin-antitoxin system RelE/ParE family toxin [Firmicutes bacterium HGW-Firmicutes-1]
MYSLRYLSLAQKDLMNIVNYISDTLKNPMAALDLVNVLDHSISRLTQFPFSCRVYQLDNYLEVEYRLLPVNYLVFYVSLIQRSL